MYQITFLLITTPVQHTWTHQLAWSNKRVKKLEFVHSLQLGVEQKMENGKETDYLGQTCDQVQQTFQMVQKTQLGILNIMLNT